jgi:hypothetical protein
LFPERVALVVLIASMPTAPILNAEGAALFQETYVNASDTAREDDFGGSVAVSNDTSLHRDVHYQ